MKFAEHLSAHITPEWRKQYINYEVKKKIEDSNCKKFFSFSSFRVKIVLLIALTDVTVVKQCACANFISMRNHMLVTSQYLCLCLRFSFSVYRLGIAATVQRWRRARSGVGSVAWDLFMFLFYWDAHRRGWHHFLELEKWSLRCNRFEMKFFPFIISSLNSIRVIRIHNIICVL